MSLRRVSIIMPVYNTKEEHLRSAIESVLNQTFKDFELIIVDDASTNNAVDIIKFYQDERIKLLCLEKNSGQAIAANEAWKISQGEYIARLDSDDIALPSRLKKQVSFLDENSDIALVGSFIEYFDGSSRVISYPTESDEIKIAMLRENVIAQPSVMFRKKDFKAMRYDDEYRNSEDYELWTRGLASGLKMANIPQVLVKYRIHKAQAGSKHTKVQVENAVKARKKYIRAFDPSLSEREVEILINLTNKQKNFSMISADETQKLLKKLVKTNVKTKFFNTRAFIQKVGEISHELQYPKLRIFSLKLFGNKKYTLYVAHKKALFNGEEKVFNLGLALTRQV